MAFLHEKINSSGIPHPPVQRLLIIRNDLCQGRGPATASDYAKTHTK
jgi:hypothetical protein